MPVILLNVGLILPEMLLHVIITMIICFCIYMQWYLKQKGMLYPSVKH